jgi:hypothetical protein
LAPGLLITRWNNVSFPGSRSGLQFCDAAPSTQIIARNATDIMVKKMVLGRSISRIIMGYPLNRSINFSVNKAIGF